MADWPVSNPRTDMALARAIAAWFRDDARELPWRLEPRDPWLSLMSEILLQQTQATRVAERFPAFVARFPTPRAMADRSVDEVLALWSGLGYYRRAHSLHACARAIVERHGGAVPGDAAALRELPGVGRYTAGAVASIAFDRREPLVDGNVSRVLMRVHGLDLAVDAPGVEAWAWGRAGDLVQAAEDVPAYSEGVMELGATLCTPRDPKCTRCPLREQCAACADGMADRIPRPKTRARRRPLALTAIVVCDASGRILLERRPAQGLWGGLWQPPTAERDGKAPRPMVASLHELGLEGVVAVRGRSSTFQFATTHREVAVRVWRGHASCPEAAQAARGNAARWHEAEAVPDLGLGSAQRRMLAAGFERGGGSP